jgi:transposase InsO family protein
MSGCRADGRDGSHERFVPNRSHQLQSLSLPNAYIESFNGRLRDECLNEHWFTSLAHAQVVIEAWRREYNEERPKKGLGGLTPAAHAKRLSERSIVTAGL